MEAWLKGPIDGVPPYLMPAAHAIVQAVDDAAAAAGSLGTAELWARPGDAASVGFHLRHMAGVPDRLLTYARGESLSDDQVARLRAEGEPGAPPEEAHALIEQLRNASERALEQIRQTPPGSLLDVRGVGTKQIPSTVLGLIFHAAEHMQRHAGALIATAKILRARS